MKANELMIGDWVYYGDKPVQVLQLSDGKDYPHIKPIPLTAEILEKNGFGKKNIFAKTMGFEIFGDENNSCGISEWYDGDWAFETFTSWTETAPDGSPDDWGFKTESRFTKMKYVHQLQHALRQCGIDKEITI